MEKENHKKKKYAAFTLIELLITIGIIIILIGISTPQVLSYINRTKMTRAQMDMNNVKTSLLAYYHDWGEYPATLDELTIDSTNTVNSATKFTINGLEGPIEYMKSIPSDIFLGQNTPQAYSYAVNTSKDVFVMWSNGPNHTGLTTPAYNTETKLFDLPSKDADDILVHP